MLEALRGTYIVKPISKYGKVRGIYTAGTRKDLPEKGIVTHAGSRPEGRPQIAEAGDIVYLRKYFWKEFRYDGEQLLKVKYQDILAVEREEMIAVRDTILMKIDYAEKIGNIYIPDNRKGYRAEAKGEVISVGPEYKYGLKPGDNVYILRMEDAFHEGFELDTPQGKLYCVREKWVMGVER
jgi:co-chaperonin GroES (HSP10)